MCGRADRRPGSACPARSTSRRWSCCCRAVTRFRGHRWGASCSTGTRPTVGWCGRCPGFDATFSAPKSLSVWWALTGDHRLLDAHDVAVTAALRRISSGSGRRPASARNGGRLHPDTNGLTMATFRQTTSRADDPQIHTHAVISAKVQTAEGRWLALDARYLKRHQRMLGGLYQSVLRAELTHRFGVEWEPIVNGQAEIAGVPDELLDVFSKRSADIDVALAAKLDEFRQREGREPSRWERGRAGPGKRRPTPGRRKSGHGAADLATRWQTEAADVGWTADQLDDAIEQAASSPPPVDRTDRHRGRRRGVGAAVVVGPARCAAGDLRRAAARVADCRDAAGPRRSNGPPTGARPLRRPRPARRHAAAVIGWPVGVDRTDRSPLHLRGRPRPGGSTSSHGRWRPKPTRPPRPPASTAPASM